MNRPEGACALRVQREDACRFVGDPVDVITGALTDATYDFRLDTPFPFELVRHYNSNDSGENRGIGWGHRHDFDHELHFTYDNTVGYIGPDGTRISFPFPQMDGARAARLGYQLERVRVNAYRVHMPDERILDFEMWRTDWPARLVAMSHPSGTTRLYYDGATGLLTSFSDSLGRTIRVDWVQIPDPLRRGAPRPQMAAFVLVGSRASPSSNDEVLLWYQYDVNGHLVGGTDRYRGSFAFEYDAHGRMSKLVDRRGYSFHYAYDSRGRCVYSGAEDGVEAVRLQYLDGATIVTLADGGQWLYEHHEGFLARVVDPYGGEHRRELDDEGRLGAETDAAGRRFEIVRDATGKAIGRRDSVGQIWPMGEAPEEPEHYVANCAREWEYGALLPDDDGLPIRRYLEMDGFSAFDIDALTPAATGDALVDTAERWKETQIADLQGLALRVERAGGARRSWSYDASGNRTRFTDFDGSTWRWSFVSWNRIHQIINPLGMITELTHSRRLLLQRVADPSGLDTEYAYDLKNRLAGVKRDGLVRETYTYDASDELAEKVDGRGHWLLRFERRDEGRQVTVRMASGERHDLVYTAARRLESAKVEGADAKQDTYAFDTNAAGQQTRDERNGQGVRRRFVGGPLAEVSVLDTFVTRYERRGGRTWAIVDPTGTTQLMQTSHGGVVRRRMSNGITEVSHYHPAGHCLAKIAYTPQGQRWSRFYECSAEADVRAIHDSARGIHRFTYDAAHRLIAETLPTGQSRAFVYSSGGTLIESPNLRGATVSRQRLYDANGSRLEYDHRQNLCARHTPLGTVHLTYDARDQLVGMSGPSFGQWSARYDVLGRRIETTFNGSTTQFYWDEDRLAAEVLPNGRVRVYVYVDDLALVPVMFVDYASVDAHPASGTRYFVLANHLGAPELIQDDQGNIIWQARYEAYGAVNVEVGASFHQPLRWPGHYFDAPTGLHYVRFRYYSPELGQFLQSDPQGIRGGFNLHAYASGNPLRYVDVQGLNECPETPPPKKKKKGAPEKEEAETPDAPDAKPKKKPRSPLSKEEEKNFRDRIKAASEGDKDKIRHERYLARQAAKKPPNPEPENYDTWKSNRNKFHERSKKGVEAEANGRKGLQEHRGGELTDNNAHQNTELNKKYGTKPDSLGKDKDGTPIVHEHKNFSGEGDKDQVYNNTKQMKAQKEMAKDQGGEHVVTMSSSKPALEGEPPQPRPHPELAKDSTVYYSDPQQGGQITHQWVQSEDSPGGGYWEPAT